ncbi:ABC transporter substrate-binding protein [Thermodesulfobacteriota bacterium]
MERKSYVFIIVSFVGALVFAGNFVSAAQTPKTVPELALYKGPDRQQILEEGAKKEGKVTFYTTGVMTQAVRPLVAAFQKRYPFIRTQIWRANIPSIIARLREEYKTGKKICDVVEGSQLIQMFMRESNIAQPFYSPNMVNMKEEALTKSPEGAYYSVAFRGSGISLGYNTTMLSEKDLPKTYQDLLDPKWKGKMAMASGGTGANWIGSMLHDYGEDFLKKIVQQDPDIHVMSGRALLDMIIAGEYGLSPTIYDSHAILSKKKGAPVDWFPLEPVPTVLGAIAMPKSSPNPHAALLFIDFEVTKEGAEIYKAAGYSPFHKEVPAPKAYKKYFGPPTMKEAKRQVDIFNRLFLKK